MCLVCDELQRTIEQHRRALKHPLDEATKDRIIAGVEEMQTKKTYAY
jgi:hypothetical protein